VLRVLRSRNYRLFWSGSFIANLGVWVQQIALGWLVYDMTRKASLLGTVSFVATCRCWRSVSWAVLSPTARRRAIMLGRLSVIATTALALSLLTATGHIAVWHIVAIS